MNLKRIAWEIGQELQHVPDVRAYTDRVYSVVNDVQRDLWVSEAWPFAYRETPLPTYPDFTFAKGTEASLIPNTDRVFTIADVNDLAGRMYPQADGVEPSLAAEHLERMVGAEWGIEAQATADRTGGNWSTGPFVVERVSQSGDVGRVWLDPRCRVTAHGTGGTFSVRFPRYRLPFDFDAFAPDAIKRDGRTLDHIDHRALRALEAGGARSASYPQAWAWDEGLDVGLPDFAIGAARLRAAAAWSPDARHMTIREELEGGVNLPASGGSWYPDRLHRFAVCWYWQGRFGPLTNTVELTIPTAATINLVVPALEANAALSPAVALGWQTAIFWALEDGPFYLHSVLDNPPSPGGVSSVVVLAGISNAGDPYRRLRYDHVRHRPRYVRLWPRPAAYEELQLRYRRRPLAMEAHEDEPDGIPEQFQRYLVFEAAARLVTGDGAPGSSPALSTVGRLRALAARKLAEMTQHYFPGRDRRHQKAAMLAPDPVYPMVLDDDFDYRG